ncbi:STAS-like domain-containing protein [Sorangium sp. So ce1151]|uniref:STAS-like domain-containing protein n=1 Tax=Sorangium sp. So ce1151 TaxID=3133332 RepID=UPI003F617B80
MKIEKKIDSGIGRVILDADGVTTMSHPFADECFGKLAEQRGLGALTTSIAFRNVPASVNSLLRYVIGTRTRQSAG